MVVRAREVDGAPGCSRSTGRARVEVSDGRDRGDDDCTGGPQGLEALSLLPPMELEDIIEPRA
jgi:hypothetical protein